MPNHNYKWVIYIKLIKYSRTKNIKYLNSHHIKIFNYWISEMISYKKSIEKDQYMDKVSIHH